MNPPECTWCHALLDPDEAASPYVVDDEPICDSCYREATFFTCTWCGEDGLQADQHRYVVVREAEAAGLPLPGLYHVDHLPYYPQGLRFGNRLHAWALTWVGFVPALDAEDGAPPCGHLCAGCQERALEDIARYAARCATVA